MDYCKYPFRKNLNPDGSPEARGAFQRDGAVGDLGEALRRETSPRRELRGCRRDRGSSCGVRKETIMDSKGRLQGSWKRLWRQEGGKHGERGLSLGMVGVSGPRDGIYRH